MHEGHDPLLLPSGGKDCGLHKMFRNHHFTELTMSEGMECVYDLSIVHLLHFLLYHHLHNTELELMELTACFNPI